jgi:hypothetical protein
MFGLKKDDPYKALISDSEGAKLLEEELTKEVLKDASFVEKQLAKLNNKFAERTSSKRKERSVITKLLLGSAVGIAIITVPYLVFGIVSNVYAGAAVYTLMGVFTTLFSSMTVVMSMTVLAIFATTAMFMWDEIYFLIWIRHFYKLGKATGYTLGKRDAVKIKNKDTIASGKPVTITSPHVEEESPFDLLAKDISLLLKHHYVHGVKLNRDEAMKLLHYRKNSKKATAEAFEFMAKAGVTVMSSGSKNAERKVAHETYAESLRQLKRYTVEQGLVQ